MLNSSDVHGYKQQLESASSRLRNSDKIPDRTKIDILEFHNYCYADGKSLARIVKYVDTLTRIAVMVGKDMRDVTKKDAIEFVKGIEMNPNFSEWTKHDYKSIFRSFMKWLRQSEDYPEEVKWIRTGVRNANTKIPEELVTEQEVQRMIQAADHPRDKAFVAVIYESGCRISELLTMQLKHVQPDLYGAKVVVNGKTGMRSVRLIASAPYLTAWMNLHPQRDNLEAPVWMLRGKSPRRNAIDYRNASIILKRLARKIGIKKRIHPHLFRHSRSTHLARILTESQMKQHLGWVQGSKMAGIYVHLSGRDVEDTLLKAYGLKRDEEAQAASMLKPKVCPRCNEGNPIDTKYCIRCSLVLDMREAIDLEQKRKQAIPVVDALRLMLNDPSIQVTLEQNTALSRRIEKLLSEKK